MEVGVQFLMAFDFLSSLFLLSNEIQLENKNNTVFVNILFQELPGMMKTVPQMDIRL